MPVQINEVIIRTTVSNEPSNTGATATANPAANSMDNAALVEQIMENIRNKNER